MFFCAWHVYNAQNGPRSHTMTGGFFYMEAIGMRISGITTEEIHIPLKTPFKTALRQTDSLSSVIVRIQCDSGAEGIGEAAPVAMITGETIASVTEVIAKYIRPAIIGMDIRHIGHICDRIQASVYGNHSAKAGVEIAVYDLFGQSCSMPLYSVLGGYTDCVETDLTISIGNASKMAADAADAVHRGFTALKLKVGNEGMGIVQKLVELSEQINAAAGQDNCISLRVDANQAWEPKDAVRIIRALEDNGLNIECVEQPVRGHDIRGLKLVKDHVNTQIMADEAVFTPEDAVNVLRADAADIINIKLMKCGGIRNALKIAAIAEGFGVRCMMGQMLESAVGTAAAAAVCASNKNIVMADLDGRELCLSSPFTGGPEFSENKIILTAAPGLGMRL